MGAVQLFDNAGNLLVTTMVHGVGQGPAIAWGPGVQTTVGSGLSHPLGVAVDGAGDVFVADYYNHQVVEVPAGGGPEIPVGSGLSGPAGVAVDGAGNVFIADYDSSLVVEVPAGGGAQTTVGSGLANPNGVAVDGAGDVFIADLDNDRVVKIPAGGGTQTTVGSGLNQPAGVALDGAGDVFIAEYGNGQVVEVSAGGGQTTVNTGSYTLSSAVGVAVDAAGDLFIADYYNYRVVEVPAGGAPTTVASGLNQPGGVALDGTGNIFIGDSLNHRVVEVQRGQPPTFSFAATAVGNISTDSPQLVTAQNIGNQLLEAVAPGLSIGANSFVQVAGSGTPADCSGTFSLAPGASCNLSISFEPQSAGNLASTATFTDNALNANPSASQSVGLQGTGTPGSQTITFTQNAPASAAYDSSFTVMATGGASGNPVVFSSAGGCTNSGATYTMISGTGSCTVIANQAGNSNYSSAPQVTESVSATGASQTITFTTPPPANAKSGGLFTVAATGGGSGNPVTFTVGAGSVCTLSGATYTMTSSTGYCYVVANQAGNSNYAAAPQVTESVTAVKTVKKVAPTVTFTGAPASAAYLSTFTVATTENSGVTPTVTSTTGSVCAVGGTTVTMKKGTGTCTVKASWATNTYYLATSVTQTTTATLLPTTTAITSTTPQAGHPLKVEVYFTVAQSGTSALPTGYVTVTASSGETCAASVAFGKCLLTFAASGSKTLTATYAGNADDSSSTSAPFSLTVE